MRGLTAALILSALLSSANGDAFEVLRARSRAQFFPAPDQLPALIATATASLKTLNSSGFWPDIDYHDQTRANWGAITHLYRVSTLVQVLCTPGSPAFEAPPLLAGMHTALDAWLTREPRFVNPNWWYAWIGEELSLQATYLLLGANRTTALEQAKLVEFSFSSAWWINSYGGGDNLSDMLRIQLWRGIASANMTAVTQSFSVLYSSVRVGHVTDVPLWEGPNDDMSYHFHGVQFLASAYGAGWVSTLLESLAVSLGTQWTMPDAAVGVLARFLAEGDLSITFGRRWDWGTQGRGIDRPALDFSWGLAGSSLRLLGSEAAAAPYAPALARFADLLDGKAVNSSALVGSKHFWTVDFYAHKRPAWGATFKGYGDNGLWAVTGNECDNSENVLGEYTGAGVVNIYSSSELDGAVEAYKSIFPLWDWVRINGVTAEVRPPVKCDSAHGSDWAVINTAFVGGVSDGVSGAVAHDFHLHNLTGQRSFFFLDDAVVALISNLSNAPSPLPVRTALASRLLPNPLLDPRGRVALQFANGTALPSLPDGNHSFAAGEVAWFTGGGVGVLPSPALPLALELGTAQGDYSSIGPFQGRVSGRLFTAVHTHGGGGALAPMAAYTITPNASAGGMPARAAAAGGVACASAQEDAHVVVARPTADGALVAAVVWARAGAAYSGCAWGGNFSMDGDAILLLRANASHVTASLAHPALWAAGGARTVQQGLQLRPSPGCSGTGLSLRLPPAGPFMGSTVALTCALASPPSRPWESGSEGK